MSMRSPMLKVEGLVKAYGPLRAVDEASFSVDAGTVVALLGPNGAGKTTTFKCILGVTGFEGTIEVDGLSVRERGKEVRRRLGYLPQTPALSDGDTCGQALEFLAQLKDSHQGPEDPLRVPRPHRPAAGRGEDGHPLHPLPGPSGRPGGPGNRAEPGAGGV